ncbi:MAG: 50S ribosomal protein L18 [Deltaproteobacteria bacterium]|nr:50S ribosomal protein L18 [Deltaproteobacteria bacterium]MBW2388549.1 50S ribosomal protein L18 [Deltaproteobacteria bacterium]MBW2696677.1 50S ribosomal protein L18 [Deltaproteobacteria bacterium]
MRSKRVAVKRDKWKARRTRTIKSLERTDRVMLTVYRSSKHIYAQLVEPESGRTIGSVSSRTQGVIEHGTGGNIEAAKKVGAALAVLAKDKKIDTVVFNRNGFLYHGRVKALADAAREAGLQF